MLRRNIKTVLPSALPAKWPSDAMEACVMFVIATAVMLVFGLILAWDLAGQPTKLRHIRKLLGLKSRRKR
jgi:hypothetical protein